MQLEVEQKSAAKMILELQTSLAELQNQHGDNIDINAGAGIGQLHSGASNET